MASGCPQDEGIGHLMECAVCLNKAKNHRALPCQHIFCHDCLVPLIHNGRLSCPTCRDDHVLKPGGVAALPKNFLLVKALERFCAQCMNRKKEILCTHCNRWLCTTCHDACRKIESLVVETTRLLSRHSEMLQDIIETRLEIEKNGIAVSSQVKRRSREIINALTAAVETKEKKLLNEIQTETQKQLTKLDALSKDISDQMKELNSFTDKYLQNLEATDISQLCGTWEKSVSGNVTTTTVSGRYFSFTPGDKMSVDNLPDIGKLHILRPVNYATGRLSHTMFGTRGSGPGALKVPSHVAVSPVSGNIVVTDTDKHRVRIFNNNGQFVSMFGSKGSKKGQFDNPHGVAVTRQGHIAVYDTHNHRIQLFTERGDHLRTIGSQGKPSRCFRVPEGMCCHRDQLYVCDRDNDRVQVLALDGTVVREVRTGEWMPWDVAVCAGGELVVVCGIMLGGLRLRVYNADGSHKATLGGGEPGSVSLEGPYGVTVTSEGHIIVTDGGTHQVHVLEQRGKLIRTFGSPGDKPGQLERPVGVVCTQEGGIVVVDQNNHRIQIFRFK